MRMLVMADRHDRSGEIEAEPVILEHRGGTLRLALDDGAIVVLDADDVLDVLLADVEERVA